MRSAGGRPAGVLDGRLTDAVAVLPRQNLVTLRRVAALSARAGDGDTAVSQRQQAVRERAERLRAARDQRPAWRATRAAFKKAAGDQAWANATDPQARNMRMPDRGYRPADNVQSATDVGSGIIVDATAVNRSTDTGRMCECVDGIASGASPDDESWGGGGRRVGGG